jgi:uncharacterized small protein (TIGR04563 family)
VNATSPSGKRKLSIYFPDFVLREMEAEAKRLDRPLSWLILRAWKIGYPQMVADRAHKEVRKPLFLKSG